MHGRRHLLVLCAALTLLTPIGVRADQVLPELRAGYITFPPIAYTDEHGNAQGTIIDLTNELAALNGYRIKWINYPINRIYHTLNNGDIDFWPGSPNVPALQNFTVESQPLGIKVKLCAFALESTPAVSSLEDLADQQLVLIRGYTYREQLNSLFSNNQHAPIVAPNNQAAMELLLRGRAQYVISYGHPVQEALQDYPLHGTRCNQLDEWPLVYVISGKHPQAQQLADQFDAAFQSYMQPGPPAQPLRDSQQRYATSP
ncbi:substrate-binding periplasmic protein [Halopseudomonas maritima]|uniref:substrate-binding periplasmic protein n=1 Tax=Halopseudomonas maritima TaxID=2918528 RepID=UPI001EEAE8C6|nr:transporter substrate-binding domain-containing protein [Halopseudomonas maritima]UJJ31695.1 transporter substrate-binding domain-containing protein [Halopseudomonas maritima]